MPIITFQDLSKIRRRYRNSKIVFCSGVFDLTHAGHVLFLESCKNLGDILVVGVGGDEAVRKNKGKNRPVLNQHLRLKMIDSLKPVNFSLLDNVNFRANDKLKFVREVFKELRPDIYVFNSDGFATEERFNLSSIYKVKAMMLQRQCPKKFESVSTSAIIEKIVKLF
ncbi:adenylyltransferase/cytidyltransferase family protein [Candidatus Gottesmanbacteria bacterium]|nr:adenylyltransferase/cytidyltransferase family protein [Candidatus Gottesmanbacteria bacterium]